jgi:hypothetical protein
MAAPQKDRDRAKRLCPEAEVGQLEIMRQMPDVAAQSA